jgi:ABC-type nitrate/sulfonate/bicarbonate transport system permease component
MKSKLTKTIGPILILFIWFILSQSNIFSDLLFPGPIKTFGSFFQMIGEGEIFKDLLATFMRVFWAFLITMLVGVPVGLFLGSSRNIYESLEFLIDFFRSTPATALFPIFILFWGVGDTSKIAAAVFSCILLVVFNTAHGVMNASKSRVLVAKIMGATKIKIFKSILFWESLPQTFVGLRVSLNYCLIIIIITEMFVGTTVGLGRKIIDLQIIYDTPEMYAVVILTGILGYILNIFFASLQKKIIHWN